MKSILLSLILFIAVQAQAVDVPAALIETNNPLEQGTYEMMISPTYVFNPSSVYMSTEVRFQPLEEFRFGGRFGTGEHGYHFGATGQYLFFKEGESPVSFGVYANVLFVRADNFSFFNFTGAPIVSRQFNFEWGGWTPYVATPLSPSLAVSSPASSDITMRATFGSQFQFKRLSNMRITPELSLNVLKSVNMFSVALAYPFEGF